MIASNKGKTDALSLLLSNGANVNAADEVMQNLDAILYTRNPFEARMGLLPLCVLH
jgi:ankyrin repeat protein